MNLTLAIALVIAAPVAAFFLAGWWLASQPDDHDRGLK